MKFNKTHGEVLMPKRVYISTPISKGILVENIRQADAAMAQLMRWGFAPFNPALSCYAGGADTDSIGTLAYAHWNGCGEFSGFNHADWLDMDFAWVEVSDAVLRLPGESRGADAECKHAAKCYVPVFHTIEALKIYFDGSIPEAK